MTLRHLALACLVALGATACHPTESPEATEALGVSTAEVATRLYATQGDTELSVETLGTFETRNGQRALVLRGTTSRYLSSVYSFVPDDIFGEASIISERRFEVVLREGHELNTVLSGLPLFISITTNTGTPRSFTARIVVAPRFFDMRGATAIILDEKVDPFYLRNGTDNLVYRGKVDVVGVSATSLSVVAPDGVPTVASVDADTYRLDWQYPVVYQAIDPHTMPMTFTATLPDGTTLHKSARLVARITELAVTAGDPYEVWPTPPCQLPVYQCIQAQPTGTDDLTACGTYRQVARCLYATACDVYPPQPLTLTSLDASSLESARVAWNAGSSPYSWSSIDTLHAYSTPQCPAAPITLEALVAELTNLGVPMVDFQWGSVTDRGGLFFGGGTRGAAFMSALDGFADTGPIQAWLASEEVPCHNCTAFNDYTVLFYPDSGKVIVLLGGSGYDS
jgi:hypothetical protein